MVYLAEWQPDVANGTVRYVVGEKDSRPWGKWEVLAAGSNFIVKQIHVNPGARLSLQRHKYRSETWTIVDGHGAVTRADETIVVAAGDIVSLPRGCIHRMENTGSSMLSFIEVQFGDILDEDDIERLADDYARC